MRKKLTLDQPVATEQPATEFHIDQVDMSFGEEGQSGVDIWLRADNGKRRQVALRGASAQSILNSVALQDLLWGVVQGHVDVADLAGTVEAE